MMRAHLYTIFLGVTIIVFSACSKGDGSSPNSMTATTGDSTFTASTVSGGPVNGSFTISGTATNNGVYTQTILLSINNYNYTTDTLSINGSSVKAFYNSIPATNGTISITSATTHHAQGTFNFYAASRGMNVTGGNFDVSW